MGLRNCRVNCDIPTMGMGKYAKNNKVYISQTDPIVGCVNINTKNYRTATPASNIVRFAPYDKPKDQLNCPEPLCITSGTLFVTAGVTLEYYAQEFMEKYVNGAITYYVKVPDGAGDLQVVTTVAGNETSVEFTDTIKRTANDLEEYLLITHSFDEGEIKALPADEVITGEHDIKITVALTTPTSGTAFTEEIGVSSIGMVRDKGDFEQNETVVLTCIDEIDLPTEVDLTDPSCLGQAPDEDSVSMELTLTAQRVTGNYLKLNPMLHKQDTTQAFDVDCRTISIKKVTVNEKEVYGFRLPDYYDDECGFISAYLPACNAVEGKLIYNNIRNMYEPDTHSFKVMKDKATGNWFMFFNEGNKNLDAVVTYPITRDAITYEANTNFVEGRRVKVYIPYEFKNGWKGYALAENAFITSFPFGMSRTDNTPLDFTIAFPAENGRHYKFVMFENDF